ncbi:MAG TPA: hypothetical protein VIH37_06245, partial [Candidatus Limnocylindrales bacterium]
MAIAVTTVHNYTELWSEPLFITACLAAVLFMMDIAARGPRTSRLVGAVLFVWLASNLRFVGVTLVPVVGVALLASTWRRPTLRSFVFAAGATGIAFAGTLFVFARNEMVGGTAAGSWNPSNASIGDLVQTTLVTAGHWLLPTAVPSLLAGLAIAVIAAYGAVILIRDPASRQPAAPLIAYVVVYVGVLVAIESRVDGHIDERYLAPVLVPALILVAVGLRDAWRRAVHARVTSGSAGRGRQLGAAAVAGVVLLAVVGYAGVNTITSVRFAALRGPVRSGYNSAAALRSTLAEAAAHSETISNDPEHTYWITGHFPTYAPRSFARYGEDAKAALLAKVRSG